MLKLSGGLTLVNMLLFNLLEWAGWCVDLENKIFCIIFAELFDIMIGMRIRK